VALYDEIPPDKRYLTLGLSTGSAGCNCRALTQLAAALRKLLDEGYSMTDRGRELGITRQAIHVLLRRAER
jgi:transposase-like protein